MDVLRLRQFGPRDIPFALAQAEREGWDTTADVFDVCRTLEPDGGAIAEIGGEAVGMITTTRYFRTGWIGNLIVRPDFRQQGVGERLMKHAMSRLAALGVATLRLEADPAGVPLYRKLGFVDEYESLRFQRMPRSWSGHDPAPEVAEADVETIAAIDAQFFGEPRAELLGLLRQRARGAYWLPDGSSLQGYAFAWNSRVGTRLGPWVADDERCAETLLQAVLGVVCETTISVGVPAPNGSAAALLEAYDFVRRPSCLRMVYGPPACAGRPERIFAIANGALG